MDEPEDYDGAVVDLDMSIQELARWFKYFGWQWHFEDGFRSPEINDILQELFHLAEVLEESGSPNGWVTRGRLIVHKDPDTPSLFGIALSVGFIERASDPGGEAACAA